MNRTAKSLGWVAAALVLAGVLCGPARAAETAFAPGEVLVQFHPQVPLSVRQRLAKSCGGVLESAHCDVLFSRVRVPRGWVIRAVEVLSRSARVAAVEPNYIVRACAVPNDPEYDRQWHFRMIDTEGAWQVSTGQDVVVAIVDSGVRSDGLDGFGERLLEGYNSFLGLRRHWEDNNFHGTHVAGTAAQETGNGIGVAGVAHNAFVLPVKALNSTGNGTVASVSSGIVWAADHGADIINLSLGTDVDSRFLQAAVDYAYEQGVTVVVAAGNGFGDPVAYPAAYERTIAVGAVDASGQLAPYSNYGFELDVVAPGGNTDLDFDGDGFPDGVLQETFSRSLGIQGVRFVWEYSWNYEFLNGTSMAAPHVAGVAALLKSLHPDWGPDEIRDVICRSAVDLGDPGHDPLFGHGLVDAGTAVLYEQVSAKQR